MRRSTLFFVASAAVTFLAVLPVQAASLTSKQVMTKMSQELGKVSSYEYTAKFSMNEQYTAAGKAKLKKTGSMIPSDTSVSGTISAIADRSDMNSRKSYLNIETNIKSSSKEIPEGLKASLSIITIAKKTYLKFRLNEPIAGLDLSQYGFYNQWIMLDIEDLAQKYLSTDYLGLKTESSLMESKLSAAQSKALLNSLNKNNLLMTVKLKDAKINGVNTLHYKYQINKTGLKKFIVDMEKITNKHTMTKKELSALDKSLKTLSTLTGEIWVGKKDYLPYRFSFNFVSNKTYSVQKMNTTFDFKNFNKAEEVNEPSSYITAEEAFNQVMNALGMPSSTSTLEGSSTN